MSLIFSLVKQYRLSKSLSIAWLFFILCVSGLCDAISPEEESIQRIQAHLVIRDYYSATEEACLALQQYPHSLSLWKLHLKALAQSGEEKVLFKQWNQFVMLFPEEKNNKEIVEWMAWTVIQNGSNSSSPIIRVTAMLGAFFSQDVKGIAILKKGLNDENTFLRAAAVKLSSMLPDIALQEEVLRLFQTETAWDVRLEAIEAVGSLNIISAKKKLLTLIAQDHCQLDELSAAVSALVAMSEAVDRKQVAQLVQSNRTGLRLLACELIVYFDQKEDLDLLLPLVDDYHADVRASALRTMGLLRQPSVGNQTVASIASKAVHDADPVVAVTAAWVLTLFQQEEGVQAFAPLLTHQIKEVRYLAAAALASLGRYGLPLMRTAFYESSDPYVRMNLALGLIGQQIEITSACNCLFSGLMRQKERWAWSDKEGFRTLSPSKLKHNDAIPNYPEAVNQLTRLEILEVLAVMRDPHAQEAIKAFLQEGNWGISGLASVLLLTEGDDEAIELVKALLKDPNQKIRAKAALILAMWGRGGDAIQVLQSLYSGADRDLKGQILEGVGRIGDPSSLPFLVEKLQEPYQTLRIIAAAALLECLYH